MWDKGLDYRTWLGFWISMTHSRLGNREEAKKYLDKAVEATKEYSAYWPPLAPIEYELLRREAESLLEAAQTDQSEPHASGNDN